MKLRTPKVDFSDELFSGPKSLSLSLLSYRILIVRNDHLSNVYSQIFLMVFVLFVSMDYFDNDRQKKLVTIDDRMKRKKILKKIFIEIRKRCERNREKIPFWNKHFFQWENLQIYSLIVVGSKFLSNNKTIRKQIKIWMNRFHLSLPTAPTF